MPPLSIGRTVTIVAGANLRSCILLLPNDQGWDTQGRRCSTAGDFPHEGSGKRGLLSSLWFACLFIASRNTSRCQPPEKFARYEDKTRS